MGSQARRGVSRTEVMILFGVAALLLALSSPLLLSAREAARQHRCQANLRQLGLALHAYHDTHDVLPPAAIWKPGPFESLALHETKRIDLTTHENWVQLLLPQLDREDLAQQFLPGRPVAVDDNETARMTALAELTCPSDDYNRSDNPHVFEPAPGRSIRFARGNYAINGGTHCYKTGPGDTAVRSGDFAHVETDETSREFRLWGNGVAGFNVCFSLDDFTNGVSTLVALEEIRAGVHPLDPRGAWALGQVGASVTWGHGANGDDFGPNNPWPRSDDIIGCAKLHETVGGEFLARENMPCVSYLDVNQNATARSRHKGGVHVLFLDGAARFLSDRVDPGLWHVLHSRETPPEVLDDDFEARPAAEDVTEEAGDPISVATANPDAEPLTVTTNSLGMEFVLLPAGEFEMGRPDAGNSHDVPSNVPPHQVRITRPFSLGKYEVTRGQYARVMDIDPKGLVPRRKDDDAAERFPVEGVTWHEAAEFCQRLSDLPEERAADRRYRLPSEAEWEYACRAGSQEPYHWAAQRAAGDKSGEAAGIQPPLPLAPVGSYPANDFGLHDLRGNVWEWTADWFDRDYYARAPADDPRGPAEGYLKVVRGGDWRFVGEPCKIDYAMLPPWKGSPFVGFRIVCETAPQAAMADLQGHD